MECVETVQYPFIINGVPRGSVTPSRGLRQGGPLSPYLFILCTEVLSGLCRRGEEDGSLPGIRVARCSPPINHLLFVDDTMFFTKTGLSCCKSLVSILKRYEEVSNQVINFSKSAITFSVKSPLEVKRRVQRSLKIRNEGGLGKYLGLSEHFGRKNKDIFPRIVDKIQQRAISWSSRFLCTAGKLVLLKAVISALPTYSMSCFKLPISLCKQIQSALTRFWWDEKSDKKKICWVSWEKLCLPKGQGDLDFREIETFNDALLAKLAWRIYDQPTSLLAQIFLGKYCVNSNILECSAPTSSSHGWKGILAGRKLMLEGLGWIVGDGSKISVWSSPWLSISTPQAPIGPPNHEDLNLKISDLINHESNSWDSEKIRQVLSQYEGEIKQIFLSFFRLRDTLVWLPDKSGTFSTKMGYNFHKVSITSPHDETFNWWTNIWKLDTAPKVKTFLWKAKNRALPIGNNLAIRGSRLT